MIASTLYASSSAAVWPMMPDNREPVAGYYRLSRCFRRADTTQMHCDLSTWRQSMPATFVTQKDMGGFVNQRIFVEGTTVFHNGARIVMLHSIRRAKPSEHVSWLYLAKPEWVHNDNSMFALIEIYEALSTPYQRLFDEIFGDDDILGRYLSAQGSITGHHSYPGGLLDHSVDTARIVGQELASGLTSCDADTALTAALLHDLGKTLEYESTKVVNGIQTVILSTRGILIGHKLSGMDLITQAAARLRDMATKTTEAMPLLTDDQLAALVHAVTASPAPDYVGIRSPITPEANLVAAADRMSSDNHLYSMQAPTASSKKPWGHRHWHIGHKRNRPYFVRQIAGAAS